MAYEKFIKKDGKLYGPYIYHSKRIDGKVVSEYHGSGKPDYKKFLIVAFGVFLLAIFIYLYSSGSGKSVTGNSVLDLSANYQKDQPLEGKIKLSLQEGELIPASSKLVLENGGKSFQYDLKDLVSDETTSGNFYVAGTSLSGSGEGYGVPGEKKISPKVYFTLSVLSEQISSISEESFNESSNGGSTVGNESQSITEQVAEPGQSSPESETQQTPTTETQETTVTQEVSDTFAQEQTQLEEATQETSSESAPITGSAIARIFSVASNFFLGLTPTGFAVVESENEIQGQVSLEEDFRYTLQEGQRAEIKPRSVKTDSKQLSDDDARLEIQGNEVTVTTSYSEDDSGFGKDYLGSDKKEIVIDISKLDLNLTEGNLKVSLVDQGQELMSLTTPIEGEGEIVAEDFAEETNPEQLPTLNVTNQAPELEVNATFNITNSTFIPPSEIELTEEEKSTLITEFGNISVEAKEATLKNGFITIRYELGDYWVEHSYDANLNNETLDLFMEADRVKWLKDIAKKLSQEEENRKNLEDFLGNVSI